MLVSDWFPNSTGNVSAFYETEITPAGWTFSIWTLINVWQGAWLIYGLSTLCRRWRGSPLHLQPGHMPLLLYASFCVTCIGYNSWLVTWANSELGAALAMVIIMSLSLDVCLWSSYRALKAHTSELVAERMRYEVWLVRVLVQNGLALYATWVAIATLLNLTVVLQYRSGVDDQVAATVSLGLLTTAVIGWFILDNFFWDVYVRYTVTPYLVTIWALAGILDKHWDSSSGASSFAAYLMALVLVESVVKLIIMIIRAVKKPLIIEGGKEGLLSGEPSTYGSTLEGEK